MIRRAAVGDQAACGDGVTAVWTFDASSPSFVPFVTCLTDGIDDGWLLWSGFESAPLAGHPAVGQSLTDSNDLGGSPDWAGYTTHHIELDMTNAAVAPDGNGGTTGAIGGTWRFHGWKEP